MQNITSFRKVASMWEIIGISSLVFLVYTLLMRAMSFLALRRRQRQFTAEYRTIKEKLAEGDEIIFAGGIHGKFVGYDGEWALIELPGRQTIKALVGSITAII